MVDLPDFLEIRSQLTNAILTVHVWAANRSSALMGRPLPLSLFVALPFALPAIWALTMRQLALPLCVGGLAWLSSTALLGADFGLVGILQFSTAFLAAICLCVKAHFDARQKTRLRIELDKTQSALALTTNRLDRERFWRRANGDPRSIIGDSEITALSDRIQSFDQKRSHETGMPHGA